MRWLLTMAGLDKLAVLRDGRLETFGDSDGVLSRTGATVRRLHPVPAAPPEERQA